jgi:hypothetical protein
MLTYGLGQVEIDAGGQLLKHKGLSGRSRSFLLRFLSHPPPFSHGITMRVSPIFLVNIPKPGILARAVRFVLRKASSFLPPSIATIVIG